MSRKVLLIIDVQVGFVKKKQQRVADFIQTLVNRGGWDIIIQSRWENYIGSQYEERLGYTDVGNSMESQMLIHTPDDHIISRTTYSCFGPKLEKLVSKEDTIYVVGLETDACVLGTLFDLWDHGYKFKVYEKGVGTGAEDLQRPALKLIQRQFGKDVLV